MPTAPSEGPCQPWTDIAAVRARCTPAILATDLDDTAITFGIELASLILWTASGRRYGLCQRIIRPCWEGETGHGFGGYTPRPPAAYPPMVAALGTDLLDNPWATGCGCTLPTLLLPGPIAAITEVMVNGTALPLTALRIKTSGLHARRALLRIDGGSWWCCNDLETDPTTVAVDNGCPAWEVTYWQGRRIPDVAQDMAGLLAEQFARLRCGTGGCDDRMVPGLTRISRRGVTREYNPADLKDPLTGQTKTGLPAVDAWISAVNPHGRVRPSAIIRPDDPERRRLWSWVDAA